MPGHGTHLISTPQWMPHDVDVWTEACQTMEFLVQTLQTVVIVPRTNLVRSRVGHCIHHISAEMENILSENLKSLK